jgi:predicted nucleic acid-binding protein
VILVDTSAWVEFDRATGSGVDLRLQHLIAETDDVAVTEPIAMEVLARARDDRREADLRRLLARFTLVPFRPTSHFDGAVRIYRTCRSAGVTPRGLIDCMIVAVAMAESIPVLAHDNDMTRISNVMALQLDGASLR